VLNIKTIWDESMVKNFLLKHLFDFIVSSVIIFSVWSFINKSSFKKTENEYKNKITELYQEINSLKNKEPALQEREKNLLTAVEEREKNLLTAEQNFKKTVDLKLLSNEDQIKELLFNIYVNLIQRNKN